MNLSYFPKYFATFDLDLDFADFRDLGDLVDLADLADLEDARDDLDFTDARLSTLSDFWSPVSANLMSKVGS